MSDISIRKAGHAGRITLTRPDALNALTHEMCLAIEGALDAWRTDPEIALIVIDAVGERAFCAGGDIAKMYINGKHGDYDYGRRFWRDEYRMNAKLFEFPKPVATFLHGFVMGGGVGIGCHGSHRIVCESSRIAMPECGIGLVPDVGGSLLLARAPGRLGTYLGVTAARMGPGDAIHGGFADYFIPEEGWRDLIADLERTGDWERIDAIAQTAPEGPLSRAGTEIDALFAGETARDIINALMASESTFAGEALKMVLKNAPLSIAATVQMIHRLRSATSIRQALEMEYRFTHRAMEHADFLEGIRAAIIDKDRRPQWRHAGVADVTNAEVSRILMPLGAEGLTFEKDTA
ncbi:MAG: enoyl-CoA hydratase/isomerase family protein [Pseudomonadota bacterium]